MPDVVLSGSLTAADGTGGTAPPAGSVLDLGCEDRPAVSLDLEGTFTGTVVIEATTAAVPAATDWFTPVVLNAAGAAVSASLTAAARRFLSGAGVGRVRLRCTSLVSGTPTATLRAGQGFVSAGGGGGGGGAVSVADGADVTQGTTTDAAAATDTTSTTIVAFWKRLLQRVTVLIGQLPAALVGGRLDVNVGATVTPANVALDATVGTTNTEIGGLTETAPATDTASSGLNGRLQRVAQRLTSLIGLLPAALISNRLDVNLGAAPASVTVGSSALPTGAAADATVGTTNTEIGGLTETAPATDTASSGLNGRLQRVAQRLTSLIALLPAALVSGRLDVNVGATVTPANVALDATVGTTNTEIGGLTETAPATDTASSGLNGRLQRVAQRLTSLIALLPTALISNRLDVNLGAAPATVTVQGGAAVGAAVSGNPLLGGISDGTNAQYMRQAPVTSAAIAATGVGLTGLATVTGTQVVPVSNPANINDGNALTAGIPASAYDFNNTNFDKHRNNIDVTLLSSASRSSTQTPANIVTYNAGAIKVVVDTTVLPGSAISNVVTINEVDVASGKSILLLTGVAIVGVSTNEYTVDPVVPAVANVTAQKRCPRVLNVVITSGNGNSATYSVGYMLLPA